MSILGLLISCSEISNAIKISDFRCEYRVNPLGIDNVNPQLSWKLKQKTQVEDKNKLLTKF